MSEMPEIQLTWNLRKRSLKMTRSTIIGFCSQKEGKLILGVDGFRVLLWRKKLCDWEKHGIFDIN